MHIVIDISFPKAEGCAIWIEQQEEKSQLGNTSSSLGWIFSTDGNSQSSSEVKDRLLAILSEGLLAKSPQKGDGIFC